jgi:hypothetical protein
LAVYVTGPTITPFFLYVTVYGVLCNIPNNCREPLLLVQVVGLVTVTEVITGDINTVTCVESCTTQPESCTVIIYVPAIGGVTGDLVGFCVVEVYPDGPVHE